MSQPSPASGLSHPLTAMASDDMLPGTGLVSLAAELHDWIAVFTANEDLLSLRSTCRTLAANTSLAFRQRFFETKAFLLSDRDSMEGLLTISKDQMLAQSIKKLIFVTGQLRSQDDDWYRRRGLKTLPSTRDNRPQQREYRKEHAKALAMEKEFSKFNGGCCRVLRDIFSNFDEARSFPAIMTVKKEDLAETIPWGLPKMQRRLGYDDCLQDGRPNTPNRAIETIYRSLLETSFAPTSLTFGTLSQSVDLKMFGKKTLRLSQALHLRELDLVISVDQDRVNPWVQHNSTWPTDLSYFTTTLNNASALQRLKISLDNYGAPRAFHAGLLDAIKLTCASPDHSASTRLQDLRLDGFRISPGLIEDIVLRYKDSLMSLHLTNIPHWDNELALAENRVRLHLAAHNAAFECNFSSKWTRPYTYVRYQH